MAKDAAVKPDEEVKQPDYDAMTLEQVQGEIGKAWEAKDMTLFVKLGKLYVKKESDLEKAKKDALLVALQETTQKTTAFIYDLIRVLTGEVDCEVYCKNLMATYSDVSLDGAEGVWFAQDFGNIIEKGINPSCRLMKSKSGGTKTGGGSGSSSYVARPEKSSDLLAQVGNHIYFENDTKVTIDKKEIEMPAGMTYREAYDYSTNGGWRNRVRMALLKEAGII